MWAGENGEGKEDGEKERRHWKESRVKLDTVDIGKRGREKGGGIRGKEVADSVVVRD